MRRQRLRQHRLLTTISQSLKRSTNNSIRLPGLALHQKRLSTTVVRVRNRSVILQGHKQSASVIKMFMSLAKPSDIRKEKSDVIFYTSLESVVTSLLKMKTGRREFQECLVNILLSIL